jgi:hypothetical protein
VKLVKNMTEEQSPKRRITDSFPTFYIIITLIFIVSIWFLFRAFIYYQEGLMDQVITSLLVAAMGLGTSGYMLFQMRKRTEMIASMTQKQSLSALECPKCGFKNIRKFAKGEFIFKATTEACPKCGANLMIAAIYQEEEKKKT